MTKVVKVMFGIGFLIGAWMMIFWMLSDICSRVWLQLKGM